MPAQRSDYGTNSGDDARRQESRKHVFVINGAPEFLDLMRELLQDERFNVTTTNFVARTFETVAVVRPDLLIVDLAIGQAAGPELLAKMRAGDATRALPIIVVSTDPSLLDEARRVAPPTSRVRYVTKPLDLDALLATVEELIGAA